jgi:hypothetical protein
MPSRVCVTLIAIAHLAAVAACTTPAQRQEAAVREAARVQGQTRERDEFIAERQTRLSKLRKGMSCDEVESTLSISFALPCRNFVGSTGDATVQLYGSTFVFANGRLDSWR